MNHPISGEGNLPKVLGLVPAYNAELFIIPTLESLAAQDYPNFEVLICDDASTDRTFEVCMDFAATHKNFKVIRNEKNLGWLKTSELLWKIGASQSDFCFSNPHDDHPLAQYTSSLISLFKNRPQAVLAIPGMRNIYSDGIVIDSFYTACSDESDLVKRASTIANRSINHWWAAYHGLHRSSTVKSVLPISPLPFGEPEYSVDLVWLVKMALQGEFLTSKDILLTKNYHKNSVSAVWSHNSTNRLALWMAILREFQKAQIPFESKRRLWGNVINLALGKLKSRIPFT